MTTYHCDKCGKEIKQIYSFRFLIYIADADRPVSYYVDNEGNRISGREECFDLCIKCYNKVMGAAYEEFKK
ncbi:MAG: hypothetical protein EOM87_03240 [Clostridia bacterium]|nr:hypothetical protein [Clostridia bacterium]